MEHDKVNDLKAGLKQRFDEILETINGRDSLLVEFDEQIFNALVEKIEVLTPTHFVFELKSGLRVEEAWNNEQLIEMIDVARTLIKNLGFINKSPG